MRLARLVFLFPVLLPAAAPSAAAAQNPIYFFRGDDARDAFGGSVSGGGDVNGDGVPDFVVGTFEDDFTATKAGSVSVFSGADGTLLYFRAGDAPDDNLGNAVSLVGDMNGDGFDDFVAGAYHGDGGNGFHSGYVRAYSGADGSVLHEWGGDGERDVFGFAVSGAGDVNADGFADVVVGSHKNDFAGAETGFARVFSGIDGSILLTLRGTTPNGFFGIAVSGAGDINGDGFDDLLIGASGDGGPLAASGAAYLFSGRTGQMLGTAFGDATGDAFGVSVSDAGDVDGDGIPDTIVGAYLADPNGLADSGLARVVRGSDASVLYTFTGRRPNDQLGLWVSGAGDVDGDGLDDLLVGAPNADDNVKASGSAYVFSGADGSILLEVFGHARGDACGNSVSDAGDVDSDGFDDVLVAAAREDAVEAGSGTARVISGALTLALGSFVPGSAGQSNSLLATGADPGAEVLFFAARRSGFTPIAFATSKALELANPSLQQTSPVNANGEAVLDVFVPAKAAGRTLYFQGVQKPGFTVSNLLIAAF